jgi:hypothetical protein
MAISSAVITYLTTWSSAFEQFYRPGVGDYLKRFGKTTRAIKKNPKRKVLGTSMEVTMKTRKNRSARVTSDLMAPPPLPGPGQYETYNVRFNHTDATANDFNALSIGFQTSWYDIKKKSDATFKDNMGDYIRQDIEDGLEDVAEEFAASFHSGSNQLLATLTAIKKNDSDLFDSATTTYLDGETSALIKVSQCAIGNIADGELVDILNQTENLFIGRSVRVVNVNPVDYTMVIAIDSNSTQSDGTTALANFNELNDKLTDDEDTVEMYLSDVLDPDTAAATERTAATMSGNLNNFFDPAQAYFSIAAGVAGRLGSTYRTLMPTRIDAASGGSDVALSADHFRAAGEAVGWANGSYLDTDKRMIVMNRDQYRSVNLLQADGGMTMLPALQSDVGKEMNKAFGFDGWTLHDPTLGSVALTVDDLAAYGVIDFLDIDTWEMVEPFPGGSSFDFLPGSMAGIWNRKMYNNEAIASGGMLAGAGAVGRPSKEFEAQGEQLYAWINVGPKRNVRILGLDKTL